MHSSRSSCWLFTFSLNWSLGVLLNNIAQVGSASTVSTNVKEAGSLGNPTTSLMLLNSVMDKILTLYIGRPAFLMAMSVENMSLVDAGLKVSEYSSGDGQRHFISAAPVSPLHLPPVAMINGVDGESDFFATLLAVLTRCDSSFVARDRHPDVTAMNTHNPHNTSTCIHPFRCLPLLVWFTSCPMPCIAILGNGHYPPSWCAR